MFVTRITHILMRIYELGPRQSWHVIYHKMHNILFAHRWRRKVLNKTDYSQLKIYVPPAKFSNPFKNLANALLINKANLYTQNIFDILGSGPQQFTKIPWHEDFRLKSQDLNADYTFDSKSFYKDISIENGKTDELKKDIKIPWELSRCQQLPILGAAYTFTHDDRYALTFVNHVEDWLNNNPYMLGVNWIGPMEVAIRAINWIWAHHYFRDASSISADFWQRFTHSLYDHMHYLEHNWEFYDGKTSNHYLSDLVGYLYVCWFFQHIKGIHKKRDWCYQELLRECDKQIFEEGTSYESSTAYHALVTELFDHVAFLCNELTLPLPATFYSKLQRMHAFIDACKINTTEMIKIGDDDSGKVTLLSFKEPHPSIHFSAKAENPSIRSALRTKDPSHTLAVHPEYFLLFKTRNVANGSGRAVHNNFYLPQKIILKSKNFNVKKKERAYFPARPEFFLRAKHTKKVSNGLGEAKTYSQFGLSMIKTDTLHISLRHHAYQKKQPSGHIHNDALSVTIAMQGIPIVIDPGSYVYTPSAHWRNHFRSVSVHNTFFIQDHEPVPFDERLFACTIPEQIVPIKNIQNILFAEHNLYKRFGLQAHRSMQLNDNKIILTDWWSAPKSIDQYTSEWNFTLHPHIMVHKENGAWFFYYKGKAIAHMTSDVEFNLHKTWVSLHYGSKIASMCLRAHIPLQLNTNIKTIWNIL